MDRCGVSDVAFPFLRLPLVAQDDVVRCLCQILPPRDVLHFSLASRHCHRLVQRLRPRRVCEHLTFSFTNGELQFGQHTVCRSKEQVAECLDAIAVTEFADVILKAEQTGSEKLFVDSIRHLADAIRFVQRVRFVMRSCSPDVIMPLVELVEALRMCDSLDCIGQHWNDAAVFPVPMLVDAMPRHSRLTFMRANFADDGLLEHLAPKLHPENRLGQLCVFSLRDFSLEGVVRFLQEGCFAAETNISLSPFPVSRSDLTTALAALGTVQYLSNTNAVRVSLPDGASVTLPLFIAPEPVPSGPLHFLQNLFRWR